jgi:hypothetical protein
MPKLSDPRITKGRAVSALVRLYLEEPEFRSELCRIRQKHSEVVLEFISRQIELLVHCSTTMTAEECHKTLRELYAFLTLAGDSDALPPDMSHRLEQMKNICLELRPYFADLRQLAYRWNLRAPWAGPMLHQDYLHDCLKTLGMPDAIDVASEQLELLYPWPPPVPPLEVKVSAWALVLFSREELQIDISRRLKTYEDQLKALGLREYPSSLKRHARWWFEHFVHGKKYDDIAQEEAYSQGGSLVSYGRNVGDAVRRFSRLIGIDIRNLTRIH